ncbi:MAG TPA: hypothetical protein PL009_08050 [Flavipsychrobacter sp.]|nr:hypothetical protein [Flavipsychrobacter sp.]
MIQTTTWHLRTLNLALAFTSLCVYLEWGKDNSTLLLFAEAEVIKRLFTDPSSALHPFTIIPLLGQLLLLINTGRRRPGKLLTYIGMACIGILVLFVAFIGVLALNIRIVASTLPFLITSVIVLRYYWLRKKQARIKEKG